MISADFYDHTYTVSVRLVTGHHGKIHVTNEWAVPAMYYNCYHLIEAQIGGGTVDFPIMRNNTKVQVSLTL
jgi:hypothetical protein